MTHGLQVVGLLVQTRPSWSHLCIAYSGCFFYCCQGTSSLEQLNNAFLSGQSPTLLDVAEGLCSGRFIV
ncbi:hypothetical protein M5D96_005826 [Drosophila gunungcola]|uniref:Uncharacterized protein n=1 Tax=Drosophila gunungcola TaxID=103775 RepID=A0A9P9YR46_9MUSC|nr:hypothetical protein M5D96_005826 [Drosophila gunungcola]